MSPAQILMGRRTRTRLPTMPELLQPQYDTTTIKPALQERQMQYKKYYDRGSRSLEALKPGETVRLREGNTWTPAMVRSCAGPPRSYVIESKDGGIYRRNRRDILRDTESCNTKAPLAPDDNPPQENETHGNKPQENQTQGSQPQDNQVQVTRLPDTHPPSDQPRTTRSGRIIRNPAKLKD